MFVWDLLKALWRDLFPRRIVWKFERVEDDFSVSRLMVTISVSDDMESVVNWINSMHDDGWELVESPREYAIRRKM